MMTFLIRPGDEEKAILVDLTHIYQSQFRCSLAHHQDSPCMAAPVTRILRLAVRSESGRVVEGLADATGLVRLGCIQSNTGTTFGKAIPLRIPAVPTSPRTLEQLWRYFTATNGNEFQG